ncbi:Membrane-bound O-acyltransferase domain-containing protein 2 [Toxocara canis]|uniref:Membrane-bound O-acyltransferase domain-containing protein 2 n=1 Tax=Toxocara canis TaxID=6265 RepID=A0A0B2VH17_TOXCA|nr:Membrane-bound O-acyltransferase domain-containing protein 2 [Toxocara canis]
MAFSLHDGRVKKVEELNEIQRREALSSVPPMLDYLSYIFHFQTVLTGPLCFYTDYMKWIDGTNAIGKNGTVEKQWRAVVSKLLQVSVFALLVVSFGTQCYPEMVAEPKYLTWGSFAWCALFFVVIFLQRTQYYFAWILADAICNVSGLGFNGYDANGRARWDLVSNVDVIRVETRVNIANPGPATASAITDPLRHRPLQIRGDIGHLRSDVVRGNCYRRRFRIVATYMLSAVWHGFFLGYYITFLTGALFTVASRTIRRCVRHHFQGSLLMRRLYDVITFTTTKVALAYATFPFVTLHLNPGLFIYRKLYFSLHILALMAIFVLPIILPPETTKKDQKSSTKNSEEAIKKSN